MPKEIHYHPGAYAANYIIDARCPEHKYRPMKFAQIFVTRTDRTVELHLHCPICDRQHTLVLSTAS